MKKKSKPQSSPPIRNPFAVPAKQKKAGIIKKKNKVRKKQIEEDRGQPPLRKRRGL